MPTENILRTTIRQAGATPRQTENLLVTFHHIVRDVRLNPIGEFFTPNVVLTMLLQICLEHHIPQPGIFAQEFVSFIAPHDPAEFTYPDNDKDPEATFMAHLTASFVQHYPHVLVGGM